MGVKVSTGLTCQICDQETNPDWDIFLERIPGGYYRQSSLWAATKAPLGWSPIRLMVKRDAHIVAGAQVLIRQWPGTMKVAHVLQGPVLLYHDLGLFDLVIDHLVTVLSNYKMNRFN